MGKERYSWLIPPVKPEECSKDLRLPYLPGVIAILDIEMIW